MRLDHYTGQEPKFKVLRRQDDGSYKEVPPFDYFVLALKDMNTFGALIAYAHDALKHGDRELYNDVMQLSGEARNRTDRKLPD